MWALEVHMTGLRRFSTRAVAFGALLPTLAALAALAACGGSGSPTTPPTPPVVVTPTPTPDPNIPPAGSGCGKPYPPMITRFTVKIHLKERDSWTVDSTPLVGPNGDYCNSIGFTDGRTICPIRPEGADDRFACELWRTGIAKDTGQPGPTWTVTLKDGTTSYCTGPTGPCEHHPAGPFSVKAFKGGLYKACSEAGACGQVDVDRGL
jgi:hypothetical protein